MIHSRRRLCYSLIDQECLEHKYKNERKQVIQLRYISDPKASWIQLTKIQLLKNTLSRMMRKTTWEWKEESTSLLFVYQTDWQKHLFAC